MSSYNTWTVPNTSESEFTSFPSTSMGTAKKCSQHLGFLQRTLRQCPQELRELAYISLVRSCAEYGAVVWDPFLKKDNQALEKIQNRAARWVSGVKRYQPASITKLHHQLNGQHSSNGGSTSDCLESCTRS